MYVIYIDMKWLSSNPRPIAKNRDRDLDRQTDKRKSYRYVSVFDSRNKCTELCYGATQWFGLESSTAEDQYIRSYAYWYSSIFENCFPYVKNINYKDYYNTKIGE